MDTIKDRTRRFAINILRFCDKLPRNMASYVMAKQLIRSATSVGANYRAALRARSKIEFIAKLGIVEEEADESIYWLELLIESCLIEEGKTNDLLKEANEITAIIVSSIRTAKRNVKSEIGSRMKSEM
jgi:four helix bundle protein